jgi:hypothetical protein
MVGYCDTDWANDLENKRSTMGFVFMMGGAAISWNNKWQPTIVLSMTELKYMTSTQFTKEVIWITKPMKELGTWKRRRQWWFDVTTKVQYRWQRIPPNMLEQSTLVFNITLFKNQLKMAKSCLNIVQRRPWWWMCLPRHYEKDNITN